MSLLRETVRRILLQESDIKDLNPTLQAGIRELERLGLHIRSWWRPEDYDNGTANSINLAVFDDLGQQRAYWIGEFQVDGECLEAYQCTNTNAHQLRGTGVGALLYDVACELTGTRGLSSDRRTVSKSAWKMWKYMWKNEQTYKRVGVYDWDGEQTPNDPSDDCFGDSWEDHDYGWRPDEHPLNLVYIKKDQTRPTLRCLELRKVLEYED